MSIEFWSVIHGNEWWSEKQCPVSKSWTNMPFSRSQRSGPLSQWTPAINSQHLAKYAPLLVKANSVYNSELTAFLKSAAPTPPPITSKRGRFQILLPVATVLFMRSYFFLWFGAIIHSCSDGSIIYIYCDLNTVYYFPEHTCSTINSRCWYLGDLGEFVDQITYSNLTWLDLHYWKICLNELVNVSWKPMLTWLWVNALCHTWLCAFCLLRTFINMHLERT